MSDTYLTRETLLKRLKLKNDEEAWDEFVSHYRCFICAAINKMGIEPADCDDLSQKVLVKLWKSLADFDYNQKQGMFRNWLYTIIRNTVLTFIRDNKTRKTNEQNAGHESGTLSSEAEINDVINSEWEKHIAALAFKNIRGKLTEKALDVFHSELNGESTSVTAKRLNVTENTIHVYRMRVRKSLVAEIKNLRERLE